jgi:hypothetical protein
MRLLSSLIDEVLFGSNIFLEETYSRDEAIQIMQQYGINNAGNLSKDELKKSFRKLSIQYHPDTSGRDTHNDFIKIQAAYEALNNSTPTQQQTNQNQQQQRSNQNQQQQQAGGFCGNCGSKLNSGDRFCLNCGTPVSAYQSQSQQTPNQEPDPYAQQEASINNKLKDPKLSPEIKEKYKQMLADLQDLRLKRELLKQGNLSADELRNMSSDVGNRRNTTMRNVQSSINSNRR